MAHLDYHRLRIFFFECEGINVILSILVNRKKTYKKRTQEEKHNINTFTVKIQCFEDFLKHVLKGLLNDTLKNKISC